jgi:hypothetical protein
LLIVGKWFIGSHNWKYVLDYVLEKIVKFGTHPIKTYHGKGRQKKMV